MSDLTGSTWTIKDQKDYYVLLVIGPSSPEGWWRCLVLMDAYGLEEVGSLINYDFTRLENDFDQLG